MSFFCPTWTWSQGATRSEYANLDLSALFPVPRFSSFGRLNGISFQVFQDVASNPISRFVPHCFIASLNVMNCGGRIRCGGFWWSPTAQWHHSILEGILPRMCRWNNNVAFPCISCRFFMFEIEDHSIISQPQQGKNSYWFATLVGIWLQCFQQKTIWGKKQFL